MCFNFVHGTEVQVVTKKGKNSAESKEYLQYVFNSATFRPTDSFLNYNTYLTCAVGLEGAQHRGGFKEKLPNAEGGEVLVPLVQSHLYGVLQALCESE
jgi:hypothetical protein